MAGEIGKAVTANRQVWKDAVAKQLAATFGDRAPALTWKSVTHADLQACGVLS